MIRKLANLDDQGAEKASEIFEVKKYGGGTFLLQIERERAYSRDILCRELLKANVALPSDRRAAFAQLDAVIAQHPTERWVYARTVGWQGGEPQFLLGDDLIGDAAGARVFPPGGPDAERRLRVHRRGKLAAWQREVAAPALMFPPFAAALCAAFEAPLVTPLGWPDTRLHLFGGTEARRLAGVAIAGSAVGLTQAHIDQLSRLTPAQVGGVVPLLTDMVVPVAESDADLAGRGQFRSCTIADKLVGSAGGRDIGLVPTAGGGWSGTVVSTAAIATQPPVVAGMLPASAGAAATIDLPVSISAWKRRDLPPTCWPYSASLLRACEQQTGTAFPHYIEFLVSEYDRLPAMVAAALADFRAAVFQTNRKLRKSPLMAGFERLYAAGAVAIAAGVVPWKPEELAAALVLCLKVACRHAGENVITIDTLRDQLKLNLEQLPPLRLFEAAHAADPADAVGFFRQDRGRRMYTVHAKSFRDWFASRAQRVAVLRWLHDAGYLQMGEVRCRPSATSTDWAERAVRWPHFGMRRSYIFQDPFPPASPPAVARIQRGQG